MENYEENAEVMTQSSYHSAHNKTPWQKVGLETAGFIPAEFVSIGVSLGVVAFADKVAPNLVQSVSKVIGKVVIEPYLENIEGALSKVCKLEECQVDKTKTREERAEALAKNTLVFSAAWALSMIAKLETRKFLNNQTGISEDPIAGKKWWQFWKMTTHESIIFGMDESVHYGSLLLMNTAGAKVTDDMISASKNVLVKMGVPEKKAHEVSVMAVVWELPNILGLLSGIGGIMGIHHKQLDKKVDAKLAEWSGKKPASHVERLSQQQAAASSHQSPQASV